MAPYRAVEGPRVSLRPELHAALRVEIDIDERLLWVGVPSVGRLRIQALSPVPFALAWILFIAFWIHVASGAGGLVGLLLVPFFTVSFPVLFSAIEGYSCASQTFYAVTSRRVLLFEGAMVRELRAVAEPKLQIEVARKHDGSGDLVFAWRERGQRGRMQAAFVGIPDVTSVEFLVRSELFPR